MTKLAIEELERRVSQLELLAWSLYRSLETYITVSDILKEEKGEM